MVTSDSVFDIPIKSKFKVTIKFHSVQTLEVEMISYSNILRCIKS